jgi:hypothetical protein
MKRRRSGIGILALATVVAAIGAGVALSGGEPSWLNALNARSDGLNRQHGLGEYTPSAVGADTQTPGWLRALMIRSDALNRQYGLGKYARSAEGVVETTPGRLRALMIRSDALNRQYQLGEYAPGP